MVETISKLNRTSRQLLQLIGREPTPEEIAEEMNLSAERIMEIQKIAQDSVSLETPIGEEDDSHLGDFIKNENAINPESKFINTELKKQLEEAMETLTEREVKVLKLRYGLEDVRTWTQKEVERKFGVTRQAIQSSEKKALRKLRRKEQLRDYLD